MTDMVDKAYIHYLDYKNDNYLSTTDKWPYNKWDIWEETARNWIQTKRKFTKLPLPHFIQKDTTPLTMDNSELIV